MIEKQKVEDEFRKELQILLNKYYAEITLSQRGGSYMKYDVIEVTMNAVYDKENFKVIRQMIEFDL